jgi:hypothetical protein
MLVTCAGLRSNLVACRIGRRKRLPIDVQTVVMWLVAVIVIQNHNYSLLPFCDYVCLVSGCDSHCDLEDQIREESIVLCIYTSI